MTPPPPPLLRQFSGVDSRGGSAGIGFFFPPADDDESLTTVLGILGGGPGGAPLLDGDEAECGLAGTSGGALPANEEAEALSLLSKPLFPPLGFGRGEGVLFRRSGEIESSLLLPPLPVLSTPKLPGKRSSCSISGGLWLIALTSSILLPMPPGPALRFRNEFLVRGTGFLFSVVVSSVPPAVSPPAEAKGAAPIDDELTFSYSDFFRGGATTEAVFW